MQMVIDIPKKYYERVKREAEGRKWAAYRAIANGKPLPEHHGRLGDLDALETEMINGIRSGNYEEGYEAFAHINNMEDCVECVRYADTIIEADKEGE